LPLKDSERTLLKELAAEQELNEDLITKILGLEREFPNLDAWGVKPDLKRRLGEIIESAVKAEGAPP
jgi:hypothetical protein